MWQASNIFSSSFFKNKKTETGFFFSSLFSFLLSLLHSPGDPAVVDVAERVGGALCRAHDDRDLLGVLRPLLLPEQSPEDQEQHLDHDEHDRPSDQARVVHAAVVVEVAAV